jgi:hypothetical protein
VAESEAAANRALAFGRTKRYDHRLRVAARKNRGSASNVGQQVEILIVFVFAAFSFAKGFLRCDEFYPLDPFDHLVAKLVFHSQP